jgi:hypothetical protein
MPAQDQTMLSYALKPSDHCCAWRVLDFEGDIVASGAEADQAAAMTAVRTAYLRAAAQLTRHLPIAA